MTPQEKIKYVKDKIDEMVQISPKGAVHIDLYTLTEYEEGPTLISNREQVAIINKLREDDYIKNVRFDKDAYGVWLEKVEFPKTSLDHLREIVLELYSQYQQYPVGKNIQYEIYVGRTDEDSDEILDERYGRLNAIKQLKSEGVITKYELESQQYIFEVAKCIINKEKLLEHINVFQNKKSIAKESEETDIYNYDEEREKILNIKVGNQHRLNRDRWLKRKNVFDVIFKFLDTSAGYAKIISIAQNKFLGHHIKKEEYLSVISSVIRRLKEKNIISLPVEDYNFREGLVESSKRTFGDNVILSIENESDFENQHSKISEFCDFIEKDGKKRFPKFYPNKKEKLEATQQLQLKALEDSLKEGLKEERITENVIKKIQDKEIPNAKQDIEKTYNASPLIRSKTLELIACEIGEFETGENLKNFLTDCGVNESLIEYPQTKWRMIYSVLVALSKSTNLNDRKILFKIIEESVHPLMHKGDKERALEIQDNFTGYLQYDGYCFSDGHIVKAIDVLIKKAENRRNERKRNEFENKVDKGLHQLFHDVMIGDSTKKSATQNPIPIQIVSGKMEVEGLRSGLEAIATKNEENTIVKNKKRIRLPHFNSTPWKDVSIRFLDERNVLIKGGNKTATADYEGLGFSNDKSNKPNLMWNFLLQMAKNNGETKPIQSPVPDNVKQIKRKISDFLKKLFKNDTEPFFDFSESKTYKLKIILIPPVVENEKNEDNLGIKDYLDETMVSKYEEPKNNDDW
ncbi:MAG: hypothetical protein A3J76_00985 [Candidatus Moranbacteria bacterium RBG_13_45_13]|nr:MAG: hypothetical protein A3J76_00985 [Candidatus Moranbacteria bacterium RBG_13_45_13]